MHKTPFAGLTAPDPDDPPLQVDGGSFATRNPDLIDHFLRIGAVDHVHDGHPSLPDPIVGASATVDTTVGSIPSGRDLYVGYTLLDNYGGETLLSPPVNVSTPDPLVAPSEPLVVEFEPDVGNMVVGSFAYAITLVDESGGETMIGPATRVQRPAGTALGQFNISGLAAELGPDLGTSWRLWRSDNGGTWHIIAAGDTDTLTDDGIMPTDQAAGPPSTPGNTRSTNSLVITMPVAPDEPGLALGSATSGFRVYISEGGAFLNPSLYAEYPVASAGAVLTVPDLELMTGAPPDVSTSIPGASPIEGGGGGGLFTYPSTYTAAFDDVTYSNDTSQEDELYFVKSDGSTVPLLIDRSFRDLAPSELQVGSAWFSPRMDVYAPGVESSARVYAADAPGIQDGEVTIKFEPAVADDDLYIYIYALIGAPGQPHYYASLNFWTGGLYMEVGIAERSIGNGYEGAGSDSNASALAADTPYWLRLAKDGTVLTGAVYDEDPTLNPAAVPLLTTTGDLEGGGGLTYLTWATRENGLPGFGWDGSDQQQRAELVRVSEIKSHATKGGDGYPTLRSSRVLVQDHDSDLRPHRSINFRGDLIVEENESVARGYTTDSVTVRFGMEGALTDDFTFAGGSASYVPQQNIAVWDGLGEVEATAAGDDGRMIFVTPMDTYHSRAELEVSAIEPGDIVGLILKAIDIDNFLVAQIDNTTGSARLQIGTMDADVFTELAGVDIPDQSGRLWLRFEHRNDTSFTPDDLGAVLYPVNPALDIAADDAVVGARLTGAAKVKFGNDVANLVGVRAFSAAGGANGLRVDTFRVAV